MRKKVSLFLALFIAVAFLLAESLSYADDSANTAKPKPKKKAAVIKKDKDNNPPGPRGGAGTNWENPAGPAGGPGASPNRRPAGNPPGPAGGPGAGPRWDRDNNPPGPKGGPGTNWENPAGPAGGPGAGPDRAAASTSGGAENQKAFANRPWEKAADANKDGVVDQTEMQQWRQSHPRRGGPGAGSGEGSYESSSTQSSYVEESGNAASAQQGGVGSVPADLQQKAIVDEEWEKAADTNKDGIVDRVEIRQWKQSHPRRGNN